MKGRTARPQKSRPPSQVAAWREARSLRDSVSSFAGLRLGGLDLQTALLRGGRKKAAHAVHLSEARGRSSFTLLLDGRADAFGPVASRYGFS
jgi:3'-phosphoadenosine 5'-phosphosulfate sulfotransferase